MRHKAFGRWLKLCIMLAVVLLTVGTLRPVTVPPARAATDVGYRDFSFEASGVSQPTAHKPQSKLWFNDSTWWGSLFNNSAGEYRVYRYDWSTHTWSDTGTLIDGRNTSYADTLWDGTHLYILSHGSSASSTSDSARLLRYSYNSSTRSYTLNSGYPVTVVSGGMEVATLAKDSAGKLWATYTRSNSTGREVVVTHTTTDDRTWVTPYIPAVTGASNLASDDISAVVAFDSQIGVMWSNQNDHKMYFIAHKDGDPGTTWSQNPALQGPGYADDHISLRSLQADSSGRVFAATKTSLNDGSNSDPTAPLILLLVLDGQGSWKRYTFSRVQDDHTRPIVLIDSENRQVYIFAHASTGSDNINSGKALTAIYYKQSSLSNISFPEGKGTPFIQNSTDKYIRNATSTKQVLNSTTDLVVLAADKSVANGGTGYYLHNRIDLASSGTDTTPPDTTIDSGPSGTVSSASASFTFSSSEANSTFECSLDAAAYGACTSPKEYTGLADGEHTFRVRATDAAGNTDSTPAERTWRVDTTAPTVTSVAPASGAVEVAITTNVSATFSEAMDAAMLTVTTFTLVKQGSTTPVAAQLSYDSATNTATLNPDSNLENGTTYTATVQGGTGGGADLAGNTLPSDNIWSFTAAASDTTPPTVTLTSPADGAVVGGSVTLSADATDDVGVDHVDFLVEGAVVGTDTTSPYSISWDSTGVVDGTAVKITARAVDTSANATTSSAHTVTTDNTAPDTTVHSGPSGTVASTSATFEFSSNEAGSSLECSLDAAAYGACTSPKEYTGLADGEHTFRVRATDAAGNTDSTPAERTWRVDTTAPETTIDTKPSNPSNSTSASFTFSSSETGSTFECSLDGSAFAVCTSPKEYAELSDAKHTFQVRATDPVGNTDATPASYTWTVDTTAPSVTLTKPSEGARVTGTVKVTASASDGSGVTQVRFYLDGKLLGTDSSAPYELSWNTRKSTKGSHTLQAQADDAAGNTGQSAIITVIVE